MKRKGLLKILLACALTVSLLSGCTLGSTGAASQSEEEKASSGTTAVEPESKVPEASKEEKKPTTPQKPKEVKPEETKEEEKEPIPEGMVKSIVTGEYIDEEIGNRRPVAFMVDNSQDAIPQSGISKASLYFEAPVEGRYTRLCPVFENYDDLARIGPLRSCRDYFISLVTGLDAIYTHYGQAAYALPWLEDDRTNNLSGLAWYANDYFYRDNTYHVMPHNAYTSGEMVNNAIDFLEYRKDLEEDYEPQYNFNWVGVTTDVSAGRDAQYVVPGYPVNTPYFVYQPDTGTYLRYQFNAPHIDAESGEQLEVKNIIFEFQNGANYQDSPYMHFDVAAGAGGEGVYITDGKCVDITWSRPNFFDPVTYYDSNGDVLKLNCGKTWICVIHNKYLNEALIGTDESNLGHVTTDERVEYAARYNSEWEAAYKNSEPNYLAEMASIRERLLAEHGGRSKAQDNI